MKQKILKWLPGLVLILFVVLFVYTCKSTFSHKGAKLKQLHGIGVIEIVDYNKKWVELPIRVGDTVNRWVLSDSDILKDSPKDWIVIEIID